MSANGSAAATGLRFCLLGPVRVLLDGQPMSFGGPGMRGVLAMLLLEPNQVVPLDRLVDVLWAHEPPVSARTMVQGYVSRLRRRLSIVDQSGTVQIRTSPPGYQLVVDESLIDVTMARRLLARALDEPLAKRAELLREAGRLWQGPELGDINGRVSAPELAELRLVIMEARVDAELELGRHREVAGELAAAVTEHPFRERLVAQLVLARYRAGRRAAALEAYQRFAKRAAAELGMDPGPELRTLHARVLRDDTGLLKMRPDAVVSPRVGVLVPAQLPAAPSGFSGREQETAWLNELLSTVDESGAAVGVIAGPAGIGKTALAVSWARSVAKRFPDGQLYASMRGFDPQHSPLDPADVLTQFLLALGVSVEDVPLEPADRAALYRSLLAGRRVLVVLDDARDSEQIRPLVPGGSRSLVLVTSRIRLDGLVAGVGARLLSLGTLPAEAAESLIERLAGPPVGRSERTLRRRLVGLCGHLPLALRIVGARMAAAKWSLAELVEELADERSRLRTLDVEDADTSVRVALDGTYRSLRPEIAGMARMLGLFPGPRIGPYSVAALCACSVAESRRRLRALAASFVVTEVDRDAFVMHDLVRIYARELAVAELPEAERLAALRRLLRHYLVGAQRARALLRPGTAELDAVPEYREVVLPPVSGERDAAAWVDNEWPNLIALAEAGTLAGEHDDVVRLARVISDFSHGARGLGQLVRPGQVLVAASV